MHPDQLAAARRALALTMPQSVAELDWYLRTHLGVKLAARAACPEHDAPLTFLAEAFFYDFPHLLQAEGLRSVPNAAVLGSRKSGKTYLMAILHLLNSLFKPGCQTGHVGASQAQGRHCYDYLRQFHLREPYAGLVTSSLMAHTAYQNGSAISVFTGSVKSVSGPTKQKLSVDEFDQWEWAHLQTALQMITATDRARAQTWLISTRYTGDGLWARLLEVAAEQGWTVYQWCEWDTAQPCPSCDPACPLYSWTNPITEAHELLCGARLLRADGFRPVADLIDTFTRTDPVTYAVQRLCGTPGAGALLLDTFDEATHVRPFPEDEGRDWPASAGVDWGYADPAVILTAKWAPSGDLWLVDLFYRSRVSPSAHLQAGRAARDRWNVHAFHADPSQPGQIDEWAAAGLPIFPAESQRITDGLSALRLRLRDNTGRATLFVDPRCAELIREFKAYRSAKGGDQPANNQADHAIDAARYLVQAGKPSVLAGYTVTPSEADYRRSERHDTRRAR